MKNSITSKNTNNNSKSKIRLGGKTQKRPLWQKVTAAVLVFVLLATAGTFGYVKWKENDLKAKAANWKYLSQAEGWFGSQVWGCTDIVDSPYGKLYHMKFVVDTANVSSRIGKVKGTRLDVLRTRKTTKTDPLTYEIVSSQANDSLFGGRYSFHEGYASVAHNDRFDINVSFVGDKYDGPGSKTWGGGSKSPAGLVGYSCKSPGGGK